MVCNGAEEFRRFSREMVREGVDTLKINVSGDAGTPASPADTTVMNDAEVAAVCGVAHELDNGIENMKALHRRGVRVLIGGDYGFAWNPVGTDARDIGHFVGMLGFSPMDAILAATRLGGQIMGLGDRLGQVRPGYLADLLLVDGDPLRDVAILQQGSRLKAIMKDGVFWKPPASAIVRTWG